MFSDPYQIVSQVFFILGAILFLALAKRLPLEDIARRRSFLILTIFAVIGSYEYWILGDFSFIPFGANLEHVIPGVEILAQQAPESRFVHELAGGVDRYAGLSFGGGFIHLESLVIEIFPRWLANLYFYLGALALALFGTYRLCMAFVPNRQDLCVAAALLYGFTISYVWDNGLSLSLTPWLCWIFVCLRGHPGYWFFVILSSALFAISNSPQSTAQGLALALFCVAFVKGWRSTLQIVAPFLILFVLIVLNWHEGIYSKLLVGPYSERFVEGAQDLYPIIHGLQLAALIGVGLAWCVDRRLSARLAIAAFASIFAPTILRLLVISFDILKPLQVVNFHYATSTSGLVHCLIFVVGAAAFYSGASKVNVPISIKHLFRVQPVNRFAFLVLGAVALGQFAMWKFQLPLTWLIEGGQSTLTGATRQFESWDRSWLPNDPVRVVSMRYRLGGSYPATSGFDTFDGNVLIHGTHRFWQAALTPKITSSVQPGLRLDSVDLQCCDTYRLSDLVDLSLLRVANVGYVFSVLPLHGNGLRQIIGPSEPEQLPRNTQPWLFDRVLKYANALINPLTVRVYELDPPLPRVYGARDIQITNNQDPQAVYEIVRKRGLDRVAAIRLSDWDETADLPSTSVKVEKFEVVTNGFVIDIADGHGLLIVNTPYLHFWKARAKGIELDTVRVNGFQMGVIVPPGTSKIDIRYERKTLMEKLVGS